MFAAPADTDFFDKVSVDEDLGTIIWPNGADIAPDSLRTCVTGPLQKLPSRSSRCLALTSGRAPELRPWLRRPNSS
jgi:hypothetical protein